MCLPGSFKCIDDHRVLLLSCTELNVGAVNPEAADMRTFLQRKWFPPWWVLCGGSVP